MTTTDAQEEHPWGFEHRPEDESTLTRWRFDVLNEKIEQTTVHVKDAAKAAMLGLKAAMAQLGARGPDPDCDAQGDEDMRTLIKAFVDMARYAKRPNYSNGDGNNAWQKWLVTLCGGLALMGVGGGIVMYGKLSAIEANQVSQQRQLDQLAGTVATLRRAP